MEPVIDLSKEYGIVLEGGGAKGAYQIGAWKALREAGIKIKGVAGTSVGALNGAFICMDDIEKAEYVWNNITYSNIMDVDDHVMKDLMNGNIPFWEALSTAFSTFSDGGVVIEPLKDLIKEYIKEDEVKNSPIEFFVLTFDLDKRKELDIDIKKVEEGRMQDFLLASAYLFPLFKNEKIEGKTYIDGGAINNVPLGSLIERGYEDIIMIRIFGVGREKRVKIPGETTVYSIEPRVNLGNMLDFDAAKSKRNMKIGYYDAKRLIYDLAGKIYYIEENEEECYYLKQLVSIDKEQMKMLMGYYHMHHEESLYIRNLMEGILPAMAVEFKFSRSWTYCDLYLAILEATAKICRIPKYHIYTVEELAGKVRERLNKLAEDKLKELPVFVRFFIGQEIVDS